jgi:hypothetical protein
VVTYRAVFWTLNADVAKRLAASERNVLRRMFGGVKVEETGESDTIMN